MCVGVYKRKQILLSIIQIIENVNRKNDYYAYYNRKTAAIRTGTKKWFYEMKNW